MQWHVAVYERDQEALKFVGRFFARLTNVDVMKVEPPATEGFHEYVITNI